MDTLKQQKLEERLADLARDVGRLRRRVDPESSLVHTVDRISGFVEDMYLILSPSAGELVSWVAPGQDDAVVEALRVVDDGWLGLQGLLGKTAA